METCLSFVIQYDHAEQHDFFNAVVNAQQANQLISLKDTERFGANESTVR